MATYLITGANRGIGLELAQQLTARGDTVIGCCRTRSAELDAIDGVRVIENVDVTQDASIQGLVAALEDTQIDVLVNNAGILKRVTLDNIDLELMRKQFEVNSLGPLRITAALLPKLAEGAKVAIVTSRMGSIADNSGGSHYGYRMSKAAVNMAGKSLAIDLKSQGISVALLHPGWVQTEMGGPNALMTTHDSARGLIERIDALNLDNSGGFWHANGEQLSW